MSENYPYSRQKVAEIIKDVRFASPKRRAVYILTGLLLAAVAVAAIKYFHNLDHEHLRNMAFDWIFISFSAGVIFCLLEVAG